MIEPWCYLWSRSIIPDNIEQRKGVNIKRVYRMGVKHKNLLYEGQNIVHHLRNINVLGANRNPAKIISINDSWIN